MLLRFEKAGGEFGGRDMNCYLPLAQYLEKLRVRTSPLTNLPIQTYKLADTNINDIIASSIANYHQHKHHH
jgi:hypothetical protein